MCNCLDLFDAKLKLEGQRIERSFLLDLDRGGMRSVPKMQAEFIGQKPRNKRRLAISPTFCPFCGGRYRSTEFIEDVLPSLVDAFGPYAQQETGR